jgi:hypothetical protein
MEVTRTTITAAKRARAYMSTPQPPPTRVGITAIIMAKRRSLSGPRKIVVEATMTEEAAITIAAVVETTMAEAVIMVAVATKTNRSTTHDRRSSRRWASFFTGGVYVPLTQACYNLCFIKDYHAEKFCKTLWG